MQKLHISSAPHILSSVTTDKIMLDVLIALLPTAAAGVIIFGIRAAVVIFVTIASAVLSEYIFCRVTDRHETVSDFSAVVCGAILGLSFPANIPLWQAAFSSVFAIVAVKCIFGGLGQNFANPAATARIFALVAFPTTVSYASPTIVDIASGATPLVLLSEGKSQSILDLLFGLRAGAIGEVCILASLLGGIYLLYRGVIKIYAPLSFILSSFALTFIITGGEFFTTLAYILSGSIIFASIFMATDYSTTPITPKGKILFGIGAGVITVLIRFYGVYPEGVSFALVLMNILTPYIIKFTAKKPFGGSEK